MKIIEFFKSIQKGFEENHKIADNLFTIIILFISVTSFFHVMEYWTLTNKWPFYIITAIATELVIIGSMMAIRYTRVAWLPFILGVLVQGIGNIFYSYLNIDVDSFYFKSFQELFQPFFELAYGDELVVANYKRVLAYSNGAFYLSPIMFLWAKMSLKDKVAKSKVNVVSEVEENKSPSTSIVIENEEPELKPEPKIEEEPKLDVLENVKEISEEIIEEKTPEKKNP